MTDELLKLIAEYILSHEDDIRNTINDFGDLLPVLELIKHNNNYGVVA